MRDRCKEVVFGGEKYTNVFLTKCPRGVWLGHQNLVGLGFFGRHLVTLNFPKHTMYLRRQSVGPLLNEGRSVAWWEGKFPSASESGTEALAKRLVSAPNLRRAEAEGYPRLFSWATPDFIPVGFQGTRLRVVELPPGDYHLEWAAIITKNDRGDAIPGLDIHAERHGHATRAIPEQGNLLLIHDYNGQLEDLAPWALLLAQAGFRVFLVDLPGHGESTGQTFSFGRDEAADLCRVLDRLTERGLNGRGMGVLGIGFGADVALDWAARDPRVGPVVAIAPYNQPEQAFQRTAREGKMSISSDLLQQALDEAAIRLDLKWGDWSGEAAARRLKEPVLFIGGGEDSLTTTNDLRALQQAAPPGSKCLWLPQADHWNAAYWFRDLAGPVQAWLREHQRRGS